jgi:hypothetical protein
MVSLLEDGSARLAYFEDSILCRRGVLRRDPLAALTLWLLRAPAETNNFSNAPA